ncbi:MAG: M14 family metallopeptidase [Gammaproteobacteria bacterium]|jgi:murein tripeptide amidase MpaA|tara:strand:+ start:421 stop:1635 length:1215 start_codon:yes stop_codon:yes gene_type:complete
MIRISYVVLCTLFLSCATTPKITFENYVDTKSKPIKFQEEKVFSFSKSGVYFSNDFQGARLNAVKQLNDSTFILSIWPENEPINSSPFYAFKIWGETSKNVFLEFDYPTGYEHRYVPKILTDENWMIADSISFQQSEENSVLRLVLDNKAKIVSGQELNSSDTVYQWVENLIEGKADFVSFKEIGKTKLNRPFKVIDINKNHSKDKPIVVFTTRQHPPEVTGYFAFQSFITNILEESELSSAFLEKYRILAFPLMNPDGVDLGHWRHNSGGVDLNRDWSKYNQKEIKNTVNFITKTLKRNNSELVLGIDFHSTYYDVFYTNEERASTTMPNFLDEWFMGLENNIPNYKVNEQASNSKQPVSKGWFLNAHKAVGVTFEIGDNTPRERIRLIGKEAAKSMMNFMVD